MEVFVLIIIVILIAWMMSLYSRNRSAGNDGRAQQARPVQLSSRLSRHEANRLAAFCKSPKLYSSGSDKASGKVEYLMSVSHKFNSQERLEFNEAFSIWEANLSKKSKRQ